MMVRLALGVLAGVCWVQMQRELSAYSAFLLPGLVLCFILGASRLWCRRWTPWVWPTCAALIAALLTTLVAQQELNRRLPSALDRASVWLDVVIHDLPTRHERGWRFEVLVISARRTSTDRVAIPAFPSRGVMHWYENGRGGLPQMLRPGERWAMQARVRQPIGTLNPGGFDFEAWMFEKRLYFSGTVQQGKQHDLPVRLDDVSGFQISIDRARDAIRQMVDTRIPESSARDVIAALLVGDQRAISVDDWRVFQRTGVSHLMSISGLHVTMLAGLAGWCGALLWRILCVWPVAAALWIPVQSVRALFSIAGALGYAMLAGFAVPAQRTALMVFVVSLGALLGIRANPWAVLSAALLIVLLMDPIALLAPGFWLSFMAVGFLFALPSDERLGSQQTSTTKVRASMVDQWRARLVSACRDAGHAQLAITFGLLPITVLFFQQIVLVGPVANAIAIPVVSFLVTPLAMLGVVESVLLKTAVFFSFAAWVQESLELFLHWCAGLSFATIDWPAPGVMRTVIASLGMWIALGRVLPARFVRYRHIGWAGLIALFGAAPSAPPYGKMDATFIDVGQGSSVLIRTNRHTLLVDTGPGMGSSDAGQRMVLPTLRRYGVRRLDRLVITHSDQDHDGGLASVAAVLPITSTLTPIPDDIPGARACRAGDRWEWDGVMFWVLHPSHTDGKDRNAVSCVIRVQDAYGGSLLLAGDIPAKTEQSLVVALAPDSGAVGRAAAHRFGARLSAQVLLAPHHGSKTSTSREFLQAVNPQLVVIQAGYRNRFGHPHPEVLDRIQAQPGRRVARTDLDGALHLQWVSGAPVIRDFWADHRRYWHIGREAS